MSAPDLNLLAIAVGNTRVRFGLFRDSKLHHPGSAPHAEPEQIVSGLSRFADEPGGLAVAVGSVNQEAADALPALLARAGLGDPELYRVGRDLPIPITHTLDDASTVGHDRLLSALGAYAKAEQACAVIDAGTAVTVDFVDGEGTFHGGSIGPGLQMILDAMHAGTSALPELTFAAPDAARGPIGKDTPHAMHLGALAAVRGMVRHLVEQYADHYGGYPQVVATGGDAPLLFEDDGLVEHIVPDLQLVGIHKACEEALADQQ